jgi:hypothetical protein
VVVKLHTNGAVIAVPLLFLAPDTVAVNVVLCASALDGVKVATVLPALKLTAPGTVVPAESLSVNDTVLGTTGWEKVAVGATDVSAPIDDAAGVTLDTVGGAFGVTAFEAADAAPVPVAFVADTVNVYVLPFVSPVTVVDVAGGLPVTVTGVCAVEPMNGVTVYLEMALPPVLAGAVQLTAADALLAVAVTAVGAPGTVGTLGITALDGADSGPVPNELLADTLNVYVVPLVNPVTVVDSAGGLPVTTFDVCAVVPMYGVTVYWNKVPPPLVLAAVQLTVAEAFPAVAVTVVGGLGVPGVTALDAADCGPVPVAFVADTLKV